MACESAVRCGDVARFSSSADFPPTGLSKNRFSSGRRVKPQAQGSFSSLRSSGCGSRRSLASPQARKASVVGASGAEEKKHELDNTHGTDRAHRRRTVRVVRPDIKRAVSSGARIAGMARRSDIARKHPSRTGQTARGHTATAAGSGVLIPAAHRRRRLRWVRSAVMVNRAGTSHRQPS
jgi:hypothetical protein